MSKKNKQKPAQQRAAAPQVGLWLQDSPICCSGYTSLDKCPEIVTACTKIAQLISTMTIHLMANTENGDVRINNELSRKIDIEPSPYMTRKQWTESVVMNLLLYGSGNSIVLPHTSDGFLGSLEVVSPSRVVLLSNTADRSYYVSIDGIHYSPDEVLHFVHNPNQYYPWKGKGFTVYLRDVANNLKQAAATEKGFMESKWKPSVIVKVDALTEEFASKSGRQKLLESYVESAEVGEPWLIPAEQFSVEQVKPLSLSDLAIADVVKIDKASVASVLGVPAFLLGVGTYNQKEWEMFVNTTVLSIVTELQQEMSRKLITSSKMYLRFNYWSLLNWDIQTISNVLLAGSDRGFISGNEYRDRIGFEPREGLDELRILENYLPWDMSGMQKKLIQGDENGE
jgi:HK97 family phage portal protein